MSIKKIMLIMYVCMYFRYFLVAIQEQLYIKFASFLTNKKCYQHKSKKSEQFQIFIK
jgi:hypothetical protein